MVVQNLRKTVEYYKQQLGKLGDTNYTEPLAKLKFLAFYDWEYSVHKHKHKHIQPCDWSA